MEEQFLTYTAKITLFLVISGSVKAPSFPLISLTVDGKCGVLWKAVMFL